MCKHTEREENQNSAHNTVSQPTQVMDASQHKADHHK